MNKEGAISGMIVGITFTAAYIIYFKFIHPELNNADHWWWGIFPEGIGALGMLLNFGTGLFVSAFTPKPPRRVVEMVDSIRIPQEREKRMNYPHNNRILWQLSETHGRACIKDIVYIHQS